MSDSSDARDPRDTVLVTGGSGFVASHLVDQLLERGYAVRASVRSLANPAKVDPLRRLGSSRKGTLELFEADLLTPGAFDEAAQGAKYVFHVASPFLTPSQIKDGLRDVVEPAVQGTQNVIQAVNRAESVQRLVVTSSVAAMFGDNADVRRMPNGTLSEASFNTTSTLDNNPYSYAKTVAEKAAWDAAAAQDRWSMVTINPGMVFGPSLTGASESGSLFLANDLMAGHLFYGAPNFAFAFVDVREVATAHIEAAERPEASGRYLLARPEMVSLPEIARAIVASNPRQGLIPRHRLPDAVVKILGPRVGGLTSAYIEKNLSIRFPIDNHRSVEELDIDYRPYQDTVLDHYESWQRWRKRS